MNRNVTSVMGSNAVLKVTITESNPIVLNDKRTWQKDGTELNGTKFVFSSDRLTLIINSVVASDAGNYIFTATNRAGSGTATIMVIVPGIIYLILLDVTFAMIQLSFPLVGLPVITQNPTFNAVNKSGTLEVTCRATAVGTDPKPTSFKWEHNGRQLVSGTRITYSTATNVQGELVGTLKIKTVTVNDDGNYRCIAVSTGGQTQSELVAVRVQGTTFCLEHKLCSLKVFIDCGSCSRNLCFTHHGYCSNWR